MQILHHQKARPLAQRSENGREDLVLGGPLTQQVGHHRVQLMRDIAKRAEGTWRAQRVADPPQGGRVGGGLRQGTQQDRLADPGLTGDQDDRPLTLGSTLGVLVEHRKGVLALEQPHSPILGVGDVRG